jgi:two-component system, OmpR family, phosphate regulon response regulator PhoB
MRKILIAEDVDEVGRLLEATLQRTHCKILRAENGTVAIDRARTEKPQLIIMDIMMPGGVDGLEAVRVLKSDQETRGCIIIVLTGKDQPADRERAYEAGADAFLTKPFSPLRLLDQIESLFGQSIDLCDRERRKHSCEFV